MKSADVDRLASPSLTDAARERLPRLIVRGDPRPGGWLNELRLAESFGISRGPAREAARELEGQGFLFSRPHRGFHVADFTPKKIRHMDEAKDFRGDKIRKPRERRARVSFSSSRQGRHRR